MCIKKYGRDAGSKAVITSVGKDGFVMVVTAVRSKKERKCNPAHLEFLNEKVDVGSREAINRALGVKEEKRHAEERKKK